jgi:heme ABC exporter ATP-binding subunit CcmA
VSERPEPAGAPAALRAEGVTRRFGRLMALRGVELEVPAGQVLAIFGPNGAGKTTFLRILACVLRPTSGRVRVHGADPLQEPERALRALGFLSHETALYLDLTPAENLLFTARLHGLPAARERVREAIAEVGLAGHDVPVRALSRGLQQRAALARALLHRPPLMLLDEPWTGLDPGAQRALRSRLLAHRAAGGTVVYTTHDLRQGFEDAERFVVLGRGRIVLDARRADCPLDELERSYAAAAGPEAA